MNRVAKRFGGQGLVSPTKVRVVVELRHRIRVTSRCVKERRTLVEDGRFPVPVGLQYTKSVPYYSIIRTTVPPLLKLLILSEKFYTEGSPPDAGLTIVSSSRC